MGVVLSSQFVELGEDGRRNERECFLASLAVEGVQHSIIAAYINPTWAILDVIDECGVGRAVFGGGALKVVDETLQIAGSCNQCGGGRVKIAKDG
ncbi:hypothetical protein D9M69_472030 [compost metagenome]